MVITPVQVAVAVVVVQVELAQTHQEQLAVQVVLAHQIVLVDRQLLTL
jgi:hypothetical protein